VKRSHVRVAERSHLAIAAPQLEGPVIRLAGNSDCIDVVGRFDQALAIDLLRVRVDEAEAVSEHPGNPVISIARSSTRRTRRRFQ
jgi:hypothetical protein